jgi:hypothetical protein
MARPKRDNTFLPRGRVEPGRQRQTTLIGSQVPRTGTGGREVPTTGAGDFFRRRIDELPRP